MNRPDPNNPPAFPKRDTVGDGIIVQNSDGMTLRDYAAIRFAEAAIASDNGAFDASIPGVVLKSAAESVARWSYILADAMLTERAKQQD